MKTTILTLIKTIALSLSVNVSLISGNTFNLAQPTSYFNIEASACAYELVTVIYTGNADVMADYFWDFGGATIISGNGQGPYIIKWEDGGIKQVSLYVEYMGQLSDTTFNYIFINKVIAGIFPAGNTIKCKGDSVTLFAYISNDCDYQWYKDGQIVSTATGPVLTVNNSGSYSVNTTSQIFGCSTLSNEVAIIIGDTDFPIDFSGNSQYITSPPFAVAFNNLTLNSGAYNFTWLFGNGKDSASNTTPLFYIYKYQGLYDVSLIAIDKLTGCRDTLTKPGYIYCTNGPTDPCNSTVSISSPINYATCPGTIVPLTANANWAIKFQWSLNGYILPDDTTNICLATESGYYQVTAADDNCTISSAPFIVNRIPTVTPVIWAEGNIRNCEPDSMLLSTPIMANYLSAVWSDGTIGYDNYVTNSGFYTVYITDINGCKSISQPFGVNASVAEPPEICIILVDSTSNKNRIVWDTPADINMIDSFNIYKETSTAGIYSLVATLGSNEREWVDLNSSPSVHSSLYRLTARDSCQIETLPGNYHKTLHLNISIASPKGYALTWGHYQGFNFGKYYIYRGTTPGDVQIFDSIAYHPLTYTYTDTTSLQTQLFYMITAVKPDGVCFGNSSKDMSGPYSQSLSNLIDNIALIDTSSQSNNSIKTDEPAMADIKISPNPTSGTLFLTLNYIPTSILDLEITDLLGKLVLRQKLFTQITKIDVSSLPKGIYIIKIGNTGSLKHIKKFVKI